MDLGPKIDHRPYLRWTDFCQTRTLKQINFRLKLANLSTLSQCYLAVTRPVVACAGSTHISLWGDKQRGWHVQSCFTLFPFYTQTTSHCHHSILQIPKGPLKSTVSELASSQAPWFLSWTAAPQGQNFRCKQGQRFPFLQVSSKPTGWQNIPKHI